MKIVAFYLPQYHSIPENDKWWGKDFTEWTNVKAAKPLYNNHYQPKEPLNDNYYSLLNKDTRKWQAELAKKYGVYGFCYYHYWFNGKKLLEKPMEQILELKEPDLPFCICWANEPWTKAWDGGERDIIMPQDYGDIEDWQDHFNYLLPFFKDKRYMLIDNKPIFIIYRTSNVKDCSKMISLWDKLLKENGFNGIYFIEMLTSFQNKPFTNVSDAVIEFEPMYTLQYNLPISYKVRMKIRKMLNYRNLNIKDYNDIWEFIIKRKKNKFKGKKTIPGAFVDWDNSPRKKNRGIIFINSSANKFEKYLIQQINKAKNKYDSDMLFINAWNEWGEGTYLEPDKKNGYSYLEAIKKALNKNH